MYQLPISGILTLHGKRIFSSHHQNNILVLVTCFLMVLRKVDGSPTNYTNTEIQETSTTVGPDISTAMEATVTMMPYVGAGGDISLPYWIAGTAFPW